MSESIIDKSSHNIASNGGLLIHEGPRLSISSWENEIQIMDFVQE